MELEITNNIIDAICLIDAELYERLSQINWCANKVTDYKVYVVTNNNTIFKEVFPEWKEETSQVLLHRLVYFLKTGSIPPYHRSEGANAKVVNHIDSNGLNNQFDNLEITTKKENSSRKSKKYKIGCYYHKHNKTWQIRKCFNSDLKSIIYIKDKENAIILSNQIDYLMDKNWNLNQIKEFAYEFRDLFD